MSNTSMPPSVNYPYWAGRLSACLEGLLEDTSSPALADIRREMAAEALEDFAQATSPDPKLSPAGDRRERAVPCTICCKSTWNIRALCDDHLPVEAVAS